MTIDNALPRRLLAPRYWHLWLALGAMRLFHLLPYRFQMALGRGFGRLAYRVVRSKRRRIAARNLELCFPELSAAERERILAQHFESLGMALLEMPLCWWGSDQRLEPLCTVEGLEHVKVALARGKGVIMLTAHMTCLEMGARLLCMHLPLHVMYRRHEDPFWEEIVRRNRARHADKVIRRQEVRSLIRSLRRNKPVWFAPDQVPRTRKETALVPFFSELAVTNTATSRLARMTGSVVIPYFPERLTGSRGYRLVIGPPIENFPSDDPAQDATQFNRLIEEHVRAMPPDYLWMHRRFKDRPPECPDAYGDLV